MPTLSERTLAALRLRSSSVRDLTAVAAIGTGTTIAAAGTGSVIASGLAFVGLSTATGGMAVLAVGAALLLPTVRRVIFPQRRSKNIGEVTKKEWKDEFWDCQIYGIGVIGSRGTGKTTVKQLLRQLSTGGVRSTEGKEYHLVKVGSEPDQFGVLIDGAGAVDAFGDQVNLAREANILIVVFDHFNTRDTNQPGKKECDEQRLEFHKRFARNVFTSLSKKAPDDLRRVIFLINKKDLWRTGPDRTKVEDWIASLEKEIKENHAAELPDALSFRPFDKDDKEDVAWLVGQLRPVMK
jgi:hypothetical protein